MKKALTLYLMITSVCALAQDRSDYVATISEKDSIQIASLRIKMAQNINPYPDSAFYYSRKIKAIALEKRFGKGIIDADYLIGQCYKRVQQIDSAIVYFNNSLILAEEINYLLGKARAYNSLCRTYYLTGDMEASASACKQAIATAKASEDPNNLIFADSHTALATAYSRQNKLQDAIKALLVVDSVHNEEPLRPDVIAAAYQSLGSIYLELEDYNASEDYFLRANGEFEKLGGNATYYLNTTNILLGQVYLLKNDLQKADSLLSLSYSFFSGLKDERTVAEISMYLGQVKAENGALEEAEAYFNESFSIHKRYERKYEASLNALELARISIEKRNPKKAIALLEEAQQLNAAVENSQVEQDSYELLANAYALSGDYKRALDFKEKAIGLKDSLQQIQSAERIKEIEGIYQTERRDREIELLTSQNQLVEEQKKNQRNILLGGLILTALIGLFFFFQYSNRKKTNRKLKELDKAKSAFFANISHEFRTPLTLIKGPVEDQLRAESLSKNQRKNLQIARSNTQRLESLVEQLLALSKLESGNLKLQVQPGNLSQFVKAQAEAFSFSIKEKQIDYTVDIKTDDAVHWFDRDAMEKILFNLLGNAVKYTEEGGTIKLSGASAGDYYLLDVSNSGDPLNESDLQMVFERFYQADSQNTGTGIGLALTKELVELHKGNISVQSSAEAGTQFSLKIPISKSYFSANEILSAALYNEVIPDEIISEESIDPHINNTEDAPILLVVDDNSEIRAYISSIFESTYKIHTATNGEEGINAAQELIPDIVISDVMMPGIDGFTVTKNLKENEITSHIPVLLLTAKTADSDKLAGVHSGADAYLTKPFNAQLLKATIANLIENRRKLQSRFAQEVVIRPKDIAISSADEQFLERLQKVMDDHITDPQFSAEPFSEAMGVSRMQLHRKLKAITGQSTTEFLRSQRLKLAATLLKSNKSSIAEIGYTVGFNDPSYFTKCFKQEFGCSPTEYIS